MTIAARTDSQARKAESARVVETAFKPKRTVMMREGKETHTRRTVSRSKVLFCDQVHDQGVVVRSPYRPALIEISGFLDDTDTHDLAGVSSQWDTVSSETRG